MTGQSDEELITQCASGDGRAMDVLVGRYHGKLIEFCLKQLGDRETSADIAQSALVRAFRSAAAFAGRSSFRTWLYTIALNLVREELRKHKRRGESLICEVTDETDEEPEWASEDESPEGAALRSIQSAELWRAVAGLSCEHRSALILKFRAGLTYEEIAEIMSAPSGTVKSWVHYAIKSLRKSLGAEDML